MRACKSFILRRKTGAVIAVLLVFMISLSACSVKTYPTKRLSKRIQPLYETFTKGVKVAENRPVTYLVHDIDADGVEDLVILYETEDEDPSVRNANVGIAFGADQVIGMVGLAAGLGWPFSDSIRPYIVENTVYASLVEPDTQTVHPYSVEIVRTEGGLEYTLKSDQYLES